MLADHPEGPLALLGVEGKKKSPGTQEYQKDAIGVELSLPSLTNKV
jgi:hypothetical protein